METTDNKAARRGPVASLLRYWSLGMICILTCFAAFLIVIIPAGREEARWLKCQGRLKQIGLALLNYHDAHGSFPPAHLTDQDGKPTHSWRLLILPYLNWKEVHDRYNFSEPWNGPSNVALAKTAAGTAECFRCPSEHGSHPEWTSYVAVVGPGTLWTGGPAPPKDAVSGRTRILVVETQESGIHWMEPRDMPYETAVAGLLQSSPHSGRVHVLLSNGEVATLKEGVSLDKIGTEGAGTAAADQ